MNLGVGDSKKPTFVSSNFVSYCCKIFLIGNLPNHINNFKEHDKLKDQNVLTFQDIAEYLTSAERNPATAVLKEPLPEYPGVVGMTILKPYIGGLSERWLKNYDQASIVPNGIRSRDLTTLPPREYKKPGPPFGTNVGQGLNVGAAIRTQSRIPILKCPAALELRQFVQYKPVSEDLRERSGCCFCGLGQELGGAGVGGGGVCVCVCVFE